MSCFKSIDCFNALYNKALVEKALGRLESADSQFQSAENIITEAERNNDQSPSHIELQKANIWNNLGEVKLEQDYHEQDYHDPALKYFDKAFLKLEELFGNSHPRVILASLNRAKVLIRQNKLSTARAEIENIQKTALANENLKQPQSIDILSEMAIWYMEYGQMKNKTEERSGQRALETANTLLTKALSYYQDRCGKNSDLALRVELNLGILLSIMGRSQKAEMAIQNLIRKYPSPDSDYVIEAHIHLALVLEDQQQHLEASRALSCVVERYYSKALLFRQQYLCNKAQFFKAMVFSRMGRPRRGGD